MPISDQQLRVFLAYTERFDRIMESAPAEFRRDPGAISLRSDTVIVARCEAAIIRYLNVCSEEMYLREHGLIWEDIWERWLPLMRSMAGHGVAKEMWKSIRGQYADTFRVFWDDLAGGTP